jgi:hypothetical protein
MGRNREAALCSNGSAKFYGVSIRVDPLLDPKGYNV